MQPCAIWAVLAFLGVLAVAALFHSFVIVPWALRAYTARMQAAAAARDSLAALDSRFGAMRGRQQAATASLARTLAAVPSPPAAYDGRVDVDGKKRGALTAAPVSQVLTTQAAVDACFDAYAACLQDSPTSMASCQSDLAACLGGGAAGVQDHVDGFLYGS